MKQHLRILLLVVSSTCAGLLLVELLVRMFFPQVLYTPRPDIWITDPGVGYRHVPNADTEAAMYGDKVHFVTDANGYRINSRSPGSTCAPRARVLMLGDSFLEGLKTEEDQTISVLTTRLLYRDYDICAQIDNTGVSGWTPNQYYIEARKALARCEYAAGVVFLYIGNDVIEAEVDSLPPRAHVPERHFRFPKTLGGGELLDAIVKPVNDILRSRSQAYVMFRSRIRRRMNTIRQKQYFPEIHRREFAASPRWQVTASVCAKIEEEFNRRGVPVFFVLIPVFYQVTVSRFDEYVKRCGIDPITVDVEQPNTILNRELAARGLKVMDPLYPMRERSQRGVDMYAGWDAHFSKEGNLFMAECVAPQLAALVK